MLTRRLPTPLRQILNSISRVADRLRLPVYLVGGPVRDLLMRRSCKDLDLAVEGDAIRLAREVASTTRGKVTSFSRFGTAKIQWPGRTCLDIATARTETYPKPAALPEVKPAGIRADLSRRDFTINAMALPVRAGRLGHLLDFFGGQDDIRRGRIKILHAGSFRDDPTRIFRAARFTQRFEFSLESKTNQALKHAVAHGMLKALSGDRWFHELMLVLAEPKPVQPLLRLAQWGVFASLQPEWRLVPSQFRALERIFKSGTHHLETADPFLVYFLALMDGLKSKEARQVLQAWPLPHVWKDVLAIWLEQREALVKKLNRWQHPRVSQLADELRIYPMEILIDLQAKIKVSSARRWIQRYVSHWQHVQPILTGRDLARLGIAPGPVYNRLFKSLRAARLDGKIGNRQDEERHLKKFLKTAAARQHPRNPNEKI